MNLTVCPHITDRSCDKLNILRYFQGLKITQSCPVSLYLLLFCKMWRRRYFTFAFVQYVKHIWLSTRIIIPRAQKNKQPNEIFVFQPWLAGVSSALCGSGTTFTGCFCELHFLCSHSPRAQKNKAAQWDDCFPAVACRKYHPLCSSSTYNHCCELHFLCSYYT